MVDETDALRAAHPKPFKRGDMSDMVHRIKESSGYFNCCGQSRIRGHAELCPNHPMHEENARGR